VTSLTGQIGMGTQAEQTRSASVGSTSAPGPSPRLVHAAHEFEAQMMKELLKPLTDSDSLTGGDDSGNGVLDSGAGSGGTLGEFAAESLGKALSEGGGFGIANGIIRQLAHSGSHTTPGKVTRNLHSNTAMRIHK